MCENNTSGRAACGIDGRQKLSARKRLPAFAALAARPQCAARGTLLRGPLSGHAHDVASEGESCVCRISDTAADPWINIDTDDMIEHGCCENRTGDDAVDNGRSAVLDKSFIPELEAELSFMACKVYLYDDAKPEMMNSAGV